MHLAEQLGYLHQCSCCEPANACLHSITKGSEPWQHLWPAQYAHALDHRTFIRSMQSRQASLLRSILLNILGEADGDEGLQKAHEVMARAYSVSH